MYGFNQHALFNQIRKLMALEVNRSLRETLAEGKQKDKRKGLCYLHWWYKCFCFRVFCSLAKSCTQLSLIVKIEHSSGKRLLLEWTSLIILYNKHGKEMLCNLWPPQPFSFSDPLMLVQSAVMTKMHAAEPERTLLRGNKSRLYKLFGRTLCWPL